MIDFELGWRAVPGMFSHIDGEVVQGAVKLIPPGLAHVELGAWCGRSLAAAAEVSPTGAVIFSFDDYVDTSEASTGAPIPASTARRLRALTVEYYRSRGVTINPVVCEASRAGQEYSGPPVFSLLVDDHHSAEQVEANINAWVPHMAEQSVMLFHDYRHTPYQIVETCERMLPPLGYVFLGQGLSGLGMWGRK